MFSILLRNISLRNPKSSIATVAAHFTASYIFKGMPRFHSTSFLFCIFSSPKAYDPHKYWCGSSKDVLSWDHVNPFKHNFGKKASSRRRPLCIVLDFISLSYLRQGLSNTAVCLIKFFMELENFQGGQSKRTTYSSWTGAMFMSSSFHIHRGGDRTSCPPPQVFLRILQPYM